jgi:hypothetical protein
MKNGVTNNAKLKGFEIINGKGRDYTWYGGTRTIRLGAGVDATEGNPTIQDCTFHDLDIPYGSYDIGGVAIFAGLYGNLSEGGDDDEYFSDINILDCTFYDCNAGGEDVVEIKGAGDGFLMDGCYFYDPGTNTSRYVSIVSWQDGGVINACLFDGDDGCEGVQVWDGDNTVSNYEFILTNNCFYSLTGVCLRLIRNGSIDLINNTFVDNDSSWPIYASTSSWAGFDDELHIDCYNNIFWDNEHSIYDYEIWLIANASNHEITLEAHHCDIEGGTSAIYEDPSGSGTITVNTSDIDNEDPKFDNQGNEDYHLDSTSNMIDAGDGSAPNLPTYDWEGDRRSYNGTPDIGADEYTD